MSLEVRFIDETGKERRSSPARDVAFFWPQLVDLAIQGLQPGKVEPWIQDYLDHHLVTPQELRRGLDAYVTFCHLSTRPELETPKDALHESGFLLVHPAVMVAVCAKLGQIVTGAFWAGIRSSTPDGGVPPTVEALRLSAQTLLNELGKPKRRSWRQWLSLLFGGQA